MLANGSNKQNIKNSVLHKTIILIKNYPNEDIAQKVMLSLTLCLLMSTFKVIFIIVLIIFT